PLLLLVLRIRRPAGITRERLVEREPLRRRPRVAITRTTARDRGVDAEQWVDRLDRRIGAEREHRAAGDEGPPWVRTRDTLGAPVAVGKIAIARRVDRLHRGDDAVRREAPQIIRTNQLDVLDLLAQLRRRPPRRLDRVEREMHRAVADRVYRGGDAGSRRTLDRRDDLVPLDGEDAAIVGTVVRFLEGRGLRPEGAVREDLEVADAQPLVPVAGAHAAL